MATGGRWGTATMRTATMRTGTVRTSTTGTGTTGTGTTGTGMGTGMTARIGALPEGTTRPADPAIRFIASIATGRQAEAMRDGAAPVEPAADRLRLAHWLSPAFPTGGFAWSQGLETAMATGGVRDAATLAAWIADALDFGGLRTEAILLARTRDPDADPDALDALARALAPSAERLAETVEQGAAFAAAVAAVTGTTQAARAYPVAVGAATRALALPTAEVAAGYLQAQALQLAAAAMRFVPLGQADGHRAVARAATRITALAPALAAAPLEAIGTATVRADLLAMAHETLPTRIFRS